MGDHGHPLMMTQQPPQVPPSTGVLDPFRVLQRQAPNEVIRWEKMTSVQPAAEVLRLLLGLIFFVVRLQGPR